MAVVMAPVYGIVMEKRKVDKASVRGIVVGHDKENKLVEVPAYKECVKLKTPDFAIAEGDTVHIGENETITVPTLNKMPAPKPGPKPSPKQKGGCEREFDGRWKLWGQRGWEIDCDVPCRLSEERCWENDWEGQRKQF